MSTHDIFNYTADPDSSEDESFTSLLPSDAVVTTSQGAPLSKSENTSLNFGPQSSSSSTTEDDIADDNDNSDRSSPSSAAESVHNTHIDVSIKPGTTVDDNNSNNVTTLATNTTKDNLDLDADYEMSEVLQHPPKEPQSESPPKSTTSSLPESVKKSFLGPLLKARQKIKMPGSGSGIPPISTRLSSLSSFNNFTTGSLTPSSATGSSGHNSFSSDAGDQSIYHTPRKYNSPSASFHTPMKDSSPSAASFHTPWKDNSELTFSKDDNETSVTGQVIDSRAQVPSVDSNLKPSASSHSLISIDSQTNKSSRDNSNSVPSIPTQTPTALTPTPTVPQQTNPLPHLSKYPVVDDSKRRMDAANSFSADLNKKRKLAEQDTEVIDLTSDTSDVEDIAPTMTNNFSKFESSIKPNGTDHKVRTDITDHYKPFDFNNRNDTKVDNSTGAAAAAADDDDDDDEIIITGSSFVTNPSPFIPTPSGINSSISHAPPSSALASKFERYMHTITIDRTPEMAARSPKYELPYRIFHPTNTYYLGPLEKYPGILPNYDKNVAFQAQDLESLRKMQANKEKVELQIQKFSSLIKKNESALEYHQYLKFENGSLLQRDHELKGQSLRESNRQLKERLAQCQKSLHKANMVLCRLYIARKNINEGLKNRNSDIHPEQHFRLERFKARRPQYFAKLSDPNSDPAYVMLQEEMEYASIMRDFKVTSTRYVGVNSLGQEYHQPIRPISFTPQQVGLLQDYSSDEDEAPSFPSKQYYNELPDFTELQNVNPYMINTARTNSGITHSGLYSRYGMPSYNDNEQDNLKELLDSIKPDEAYEEGIESTPEELNISLLKHQRIGLKWMLDKEKSGNKGGILADDMGLGKTIQAISIMVANQSEDDKCKANLVVAPVSLLTQWAQEIDTKVKAKTKFTYYIYHQQNKAKSFKELSKYNVILISYNTLTSEMKKHFALALSELKNNAKLPEGGGGESYQSPFFTSDANFYRIILDEAQMIKNKLTQASKSVALLKSTYRWCLSGTPMQNSINELYPLLRFLRIRPYNDDERFKNAITAQLSTRGGENRALRKVQAILTAILLRRTKNSMIDGKPILELPDKHIVFDHVVMHDAEKRFYEALESSSKMKADKILNAEKIEGAGRGDYSSILTLLLRMRQACDHRYLVDIGEDKVREFKNETVKDGFHSAVKFSDETKRRIIRERKDGFTCQNCYDMISVDSNVVLLSSCGHAICKDCVDTFFDDNMETEWNGDKSARCKVCSVAALQKSSCNLAVFEAAVENNMTWPQVQKHFGLNQVALNTKQRNVKIQELIDNDGQGKIAVSAKIDKTLELIDEIEEKHPGEKIIIFSQFTMMFDVLQFFLNYRGVQFLRYDGTMNVQEKTTTISTFYQDPDKKLLLLSLKSGNVGLTLTCASHVIILEPFWNPYVEKQAQDRVHRISQTREVYIHRILIEGTIEDRIMELQKQKEDLVDSALDPEARKSATRLSRTEMRYLFGLSDRL